MRKKSLQNPPPTPKIGAPGGQVYAWPHSDQIKIQISVQKVIVRMSIVSIINALVVMDNSALLRLVYRKSFSSNLRYLRKRESILPLEIAGDSKVF